MVDVEGHPVSLNVGGQPFTANYNTLLRDPASRLALLVRGIIPSSRVDLGQSLFVDRDPKYFGQILNYLRDGWCVVPGDPAERREMLQEVRYYQLAHMEAWIRTQELLGDRSDAMGPLKLGSLSSPTSVLSPAATPGRYGTSPALLTSSADFSTPSRVRRSLPAPGDLSGTTLSAPASPSTPMHHSALLPPASVSPVATRHSYSHGLLPSPKLDDEFRWTARYLRTNDKLRRVVETLVEMAYMPPHPALHVGKVHISVQSSYDLETPRSTLYPRFQVVKIAGAMGWNYEFTIRPATDYSLYEKYNVCEYVQDNWFVLCAVLKDQYGLIMEEDYLIPKPTSLLARKYSMAVTIFRSP